MADEKQNNTNTKQGTTENIDAAQNDTAINEEQTSSNLDDIVITDEEKSNFNDFRNIIEGIFSSDDKKRFVNFINIEKYYKEQYFVNDPKLEFEESSETGKRNKTNRLVDYRKVFGNNYKEIYDYLRRIATIKIDFAMHDYFYEESVAEEEQNQSNSANSTNIKKEEKQTEKKEEKQTDDTILKSTTIFFSENISSIKIIDDFENDLMSIIEVEFNINQKKLLSIYLRLTSEDPSIRFYIEPTYKVRNESKGNTEITGSYNELLYYFQNRNAFTRVPLRAVELPTTSLLPLDNPKNKISNFPTVKAMLYLVPEPALILKRINFSFYNIANDTTGFTYNGNSYSWSGNTVRGIENGVEKDFNIIDLSGGSGSTSLNLFFSNLLAKIKNIYPDIRLLAKEANNTNVLTCLSFDNDNIFKIISTLDQKYGLHFFGSTVHCEGNILYVGDKQLDFLNNQIDIYLEVLPGVEQKNGFVFLTYTEINSLYELEQKKIEEELKKKLSDDEKKRLQEKLQDTKRELENLKNDNEFRSRLYIFTSINNVHPDYHTFSSREINGERIIIRTGGVDKDLLLPRNISGSNIFGFFNLFDPSISLRDSLTEFVFNNFLNVTNKNQEESEKNKEKNRKKQNRYRKFVNMYRTLINEKKNQLNNSSLFTETLARIKRYKKENNSYFFETRLMSYLNDQIGRFNIEITGVFPEFFHHGKHIYIHFHDYLYSLFYNGEYKVTKRETFLPIEGKNLETIPKILITVNKVIDEIPYNFEDVLNNLLFPNNDYKKITEANTMATGEGGGGFYNTTDGIAKAGVTKNFIEFIKNNVNFTCVNNDEIKSNTQNEYEKIKEKDNVNSSSYISKRLNIFDNINDNTKKDIEQKITKGEISKFVKVCYNNSTDKDSNLLIFCNYDISSYYTKNTSNSTSYKQAASGNQYLNSLIENGVVKDPKTNLGNIIYNEVYYIHALTAHDDKSEDEIKQLIVGNKREKPTPFPKALNSKFNSYSVDYIVNLFLAIAMRESRFIFAKNPASSACGIFQFLVKLTGASYGLTYSNWGNIVHNVTVMYAYYRDIIKNLFEKGILTTNNITGGNFNLDYLTILIYLSHWLGEAGMVNLIKAVYIFRNDAIKDSIENLGNFPIHELIKKQENTYILENENIFNIIKQFFNNNSNNVVNFIKNLFTIEKNIFSHLTADFTTNKDLFNLSIDEYIKNRNSTNNAAKEQFKEVMKKVKQVNLSNIYEYAIYKMCGEEKGGIIYYFYNLDNVAKSTPVDTSKDVIPNYNYKTDEIIKKHLNINEPPFNEPLFENTLKRLASTHPNYREAFVKFYKDVYEKVKNNHNIIMIVSSAYRTFSEQNKISGDKTNAKGGQSYHNYGIAIDLNTYSDDKGKKIDKKLFEKIWMETVPEIGKKYGLACGGFIEGFPNGDWGHYQPYPYPPIEELLKRYKNEQFDSNKYLDLTNIPLKNPKFKNNNIYNKS